MRRVGTVVIKSNELQKLTPENEPNRPATRVGGPLPRSVVDGALGTERKRRGRASGNEPHPGHTHEAYGCSHVFSARGTSDAATDAPVHMRSGELNPASTHFAPSGSALALANVDELGMPTACGAQALTDSLKSDKLITYSLEVGHARSSIKLHIPESHLTELFAAGWTRETLNDLFRRGIEDRAKRGGPTLESLTRKGKSVTLALVDRSAHLWEQHEATGAIFINRALLDLRRLSLPASEATREKLGLTSKHADALRDLADALLYTGFSHEYWHRAQGKGGEIEEALTSQDSALLGDFLQHVKPAVLSQALDAMPMLAKHTSAFLLKSVAISSSGSRPSGGKAKGPHEVATGRADLAHELVSLEPTGRSKSVPSAPGAQLRALAQRFHVTTEYAKKIWLLGEFGLSKPSGPPFSAGLADVLGMDTARLYDRLVRVETRTTDLPGLLKTHPEVLRGQRISAELDFLTDFGGGAAMPASQLADVQPMHIEMAYLVLEAALKNRAILFDNIRDFARLYRAVAEHTGNPKVLTSGNPKQARKAIATAIGVVLDLDSTLTGQPALPLAKEEEELEQSGPIERATLPEEPRGLETRFNLLRQIFSPVFPTGLPAPKAPQVPTQLEKTNLNALGYMFEETLKLKQQHPAIVEPKTIDDWLALYHSLERSFSGTDQSLADRWKGGRPVQGAKNVTGRRLRELLLWPVLVPSGESRRIKSPDSITDDQKFDAELMLSKIYVEHSEFPIAYIQRVLSQHTGLQNIEVATLDRLLELAKRAGIPVESLGELVHLYLHVDNALLAGPKISGQPASGLKARLDESGNALVAVGPALRYYQPKARAIAQRELAEGRVQPLPPPAAPEAPIAEQLADLTTRHEAMKTRLEAYVDALTTAPSDEGGWTDLLGTRANLEEDVGQMLEDGHRLRDRTLVAEPKTAEQASAIANQVIYESATLEELAREAIASWLGDELAPTFQRAAEHLFIRPADYTDGLSGLIQGALQAHPSLAAYPQLSAAVEEAYVAAFARLTTEPR